MDVPVRSLDDISEERHTGPVLIDTYDSTIVVPPEATVRKSQGNLVVSLH
jgi:hypothetical protein